jgi:hypothetical protein
VRAASSRFGQFSETIPVVVGQFGRPRVGTMDTATAQLTSRFLPEDFWW